MALYYMRALQFFKFSKRLGPKLIMIKKMVCTFLSLEKLIHFLVELEMI